MQADARIRALEATIVRMGREKSEVLRRYEEKKGESEKILNDSLRKMEEIKNVRSKCLDAPLSCFSAGSPALTCASLQNLNMIEARLEKLDKEKEELSQYYALDKERRCGLSPCPHESPCPLSGVQ